MKEVFSSMEVPCATTPGTTMKLWLCAGRANIFSQLRKSEFTQIGSLATIELWLVPTHILVVWKREPSLLSAISGLACHS